MFSRDAIDKEIFVSRLSDSIEWLVQHSMTDTEMLLTKFAHDAESQSARDLKADKSERFLRGLIQNRLQVFGTTKREAHEGSGQTDVWFRRTSASFEELIEAKVPLSLSQFDDGLVETAQYAQTSGLTEAFFVFVDHCKDLNHKRFTDSTVAHRLVDDIAITCIAIRVSESPPSKVGRNRRLSAS